VEAPLLTVVVRQSGDGTNPPVTIQSDGLIALHFREF
jgi:hypothetical protein